jgi:hypothetical protein
MDYKMTSDELRKAIARKTRLAAKYVKVWGSADGFGHVVMIQDRQYRYDQFMGLWTTTLRDGAFVDANYLVS